MANFAFDISIGREVELYNRVNNNDPSTSGLVFLVLALSGLESDDTLRTYTTVSALLAAANDEVANANYARKVLTDVDLAVPTSDAVAHTTTLFFPSQTFTNIGAGATWAKAVLAYDPDTTGGSDTTLVPICAWDLRDANGNYLIPATTTYVIGAANGFLVAS